MNKTTIVLKLFIPVLCLLLLMAVLVHDTSIFASASVVYENSVEKEIDMDGNSGSNIFAKDILIETQTNKMRSLIETELSNRNTDISSELWKLVRSYEDMLAVETSKERCDKITRLLGTTRAMIADNHNYLVSQSSVTDDNKNNSAHRGIAQSRSNDVIYCRVVTCGHCIF